MKRLTMALLGLAALAATGCATTDDGAVKVIAHRGFWRTNPAVPHNSIAALQNAIDLKCFGTEFDIWVTSDGIPVVFHDRNTRAGNIVLQEVTYADLIARDGLLENGERIPTLDEYLEVWKKSDKKVKLIFEIKSHDTAELDRAAAQKVHEIALKHKIKPAKMEYIAFSKEVCKTLTAMNSGVPVAYLNGDLTPAEAKSQLGCTGIDYNVSRLKEHPEWIAEAHELGMTVNVWTVNKNDDLQHFITSGVDYITTDRPDALMNMLSAEE